MVFTIKIDPLVLEAESIEQAQELADDYFHSNEFETNLNEISEGRND